MQRLSKEICWPNNRNNEKKKKNAKNTKIGAKEIQKKNKKSTNRHDGIAFHHHQTGHTIDFANTKTWGKRKVTWGD